MLEGCLDRFGAWVFGAIFLAAGAWVLVSAPTAPTPALSAVLGLLLVHTAAMSIVGFGLGRATKVLASTWVVFVLVFLVVAALLRS